jgi:hypothetical protein
MAWVFETAPTVSPTEQLVLLAIADHCADDLQEAAAQTATLRRLLAGPRPWTELITMDAVAAIGRANADWPDDVPMEDFILALRHEVERLERRR